MIVSLSESPSAASLAREVLGCRQHMRQARREITHTVSMLKNTAPGICASPYSCAALRPVGGSASYRQPPSYRDGDGLAQPCSGNEGDFSEEIGHGLCSGVFVIRQTRSHAAVHLALLLDWR